MSQPTLITDVIAGADSLRTTSRAAQAGDSGSEFRNAFDTQLKRSESFPQRSSENTAEAHQTKEEKRSAAVDGPAHADSTSARSERHNDVQNAEEAPAVAGDPATELTDPVAVTVTLDAAAVTSSVVDGGSV